MSQDYHIHTVVSDGEDHPFELLTAAAELGLATISLTDHDSVGAYDHFPGLFQRAEELGLRLETGVELDAECRGREIHVLGYGFRLDDPELRRHLAGTQAARRRRLEVQLAALNRALPPERAIPADEVFRPHRDTLMNPHLVKAVQSRLGEADYRRARAWVAEVAPATVTVPKAPAAEMVRLVTGAGGRAVLAHPAYFAREYGWDLAGVIEDLLPAGLAGVEVEYPYWKDGSGDFPGPAEEAAAVAEVGRLADHFGLPHTRGSDAHSAAELRTLHRRGFPAGCR